MSRLAAAGRSLAVGVAWAAAWGPAAVLIGIGVIDPDNSMDEMWVAVGAYPGFISGVIFWLLSSATVRSRKLEALALPRAGLLGAIAALPIGLIPFAIGDRTSAIPLWQLLGGWMGFVVLMSALSAVVTVLAARALVERRPQRA